MNNLTLVKFLNNEENYLKISKEDFKDYIFLDLFKQENMENHFSYIKNIEILIDNLFNIEINKDTSLLNFVLENDKFEKYLNDQDLAYNCAKYSNLMQLLNAKHQGITHDNLFHEYSKLELEDKTIKNNILLIALNNAILSLLKENSHNKSENIRVCFNKNFYDLNYVFYARFA